MKKFVLFKSPTCGPCRMFQPNLQAAANTLNAELEIVDVTTDEGLKYAQENGVTKSGVAWYEVDGEVKIRWERPYPTQKLLEDIEKL